MRSILVIQLRSLHPPWRCGAATSRNQPTTTHALEMSLRSILGGSRVKKKKPSSSRTTGNSYSGFSSPSSSSSSALSSWPHTKPSVAQRRRTPGAKRKDTATAAAAAAAVSASRSAGDGDDDGYDYFHDDEDEQLPDHGLVRALADDPTLRDIPQAMRHARQHMFDSMPASRAGMDSTRVSTVLRYRAALPPVATTAHVQALLLAAGPTAVEREKAELVRAGAVRRIVVLRRGGVSEALVLAADLEALVRRAAEDDGDGGALDAATADAFLAFLEANPTAVRVPRVVVAAAGALACSGQGPSLSRRQTDKLVRAGFLTSQHTGHDVGTGGGSMSRPEDRYSLMSLETVSRAASGSVAAVGGQNVLHSAGGSGAGRGGPTVDFVTGAGDLSLAVPGHGAYLKLISSALEHLASLLERSPYREAPESSLREKWEGGVVRNETSLAKMSRGQFVGVLPGRTKKWKDFYGLSFDWILQEAVGTGLVEVFETGSVGHGVRLV